MQNTTRENCGILQKNSHLRATAYGGNDFENKLWSNIFFNNIKYKFKVIIQEKNDNSTWIKL